MSTPRRPNLVIIYPDQMRADAMSCAGAARLKTPHIDRLAIEGARFENAFVSFPLCSPFRASLFTGKYAHAHGVCANHFPIPLGQDFLPQILRDAGYRTGYIGKWHLDGGAKPGFVPPGERRLGFEHFVGFNRGHFYFDSIYFRDTDQPYHCDRYEPDFQTDHLIEFMESCVQDDPSRPFFAMVCFGPPHGPIQSPLSFRDLYRPEETAPRANTPEELLPRAREFLAGYYGMMADVDYNVGRILNWLDRRGLADDTIVVLLSDHGDMAGEHGRWGKKCAYDASMRVPLLIRYPGRIKPMRAITHLVDASVDVMPTLLELCGLSPPDAVQGFSFLSLLDGDPTPTRTKAYFEICKQSEGPERFPTPQRGVRTLDWLYVRTPDEPLLLFDLRNDPLEQNNLVNAPRYADVQDHLDRRLAAHMLDTDDDWDIEAEFPPPDFVTHEQGARNARELLKRAVVEP